MNEQTNDFKPYLKKALVLLMAVVMVFTYMPSMAFAEVQKGNEDAGDMTIETQYAQYAGGIIAAPIHDNSGEIADKDLAAYYQAFYKDGTATIAAVDLKEHTNANNVKGRWVGLAIEIPTNTTYSEIKVGVNSAKLSSAAMEKADYTLNDNEYMTLYWSLDRTEPVENIYVSFDSKTIYKISVKTVTDCNIYVGDSKYSGTEQFVLGKTYQMTAYICAADWSAYSKCKWDTTGASSYIGIDASAADATYGYGASVSFAPTKAGKYQLNLKDENDTLIKAVDIEVVANDLRGLANGDLDFYYDDEHKSEYSMLGNSWYAGEELVATKDESAESLGRKYRYLSACTTIPANKKFSDLSVNWYYSSTYSPTGAGYTKVATDGNGSGTAGNDNQITYYNGKGTYADYFFFNIYPDVKTAGTYYYYVEISDETNTITSISNQAVVTVSLPQGSLRDLESGNLKFYYDDKNKYEYSMLGNNWYAGNELKAVTNESAEDLRTNYRYLSACTTIPADKEFGDLSVDWYYGSTYSPTGEGYTKVTTGGVANGTNGQITYYNGRSTYADYFFFNIYPDVSAAGTYYYYAEISYEDGDKTYMISSKTCQAMVVIANKQQSEALKGNITVDFTLNSYGSFPGISKTSVTVKNGSTVGDVFKKVLDAQGYTYEGLEKGYISTITSASKVTLAHFDAGKNSGWMYLVNDKAPDYTLNSYVLSDGDDIVWYYTGDYTKDSYARASMSTTTTTVTTDTASGSTATTAPTETKVTEKTNTDGTKEKTATVTVSTNNQTEIIKQAADKKSTEIVLEVASTATNGAQNVQLQLNVSFVKNVSEKTDAALTVNTENGTVSLDQDTIKTVLDEAKGTTITLDVNKVVSPTEVQKKAAGTNGQILSLTVKSGDKTISDFKTGKVTVTVAISTALQNKRVAAIHIAEDGKIEQMPGKSREVGGKKCFEFTTSHFSDFALVDADELGLETEDEIDAAATAALVAKLTPVARSAKTAKGYIKVTTNLDKSDKAIISDLKDAGYTVKYRFYRSTKKSANYKSALTKQATTYTNTAGKKGTKYYYKVQVRAYDASGKLVAKTALKQCKYACRTK